MRVERADADQVRQRMEALRRRAEGDDVASVVHTSALQEYEERLARAEDDVEASRVARRQAQAAKERERQAQEMESVDPEIAALMGFGSFGGAKKKT